MPFDPSVYLSIFIFTFLSREMGRALDGALSKYSFLFLINLMHSCISDYASCICFLTILFFLCVWVCVAALGGLVTYSYPLQSPPRTKSKMN
jgi:hypothetical protein